MGHAHRLADVCGEDGGVERDVADVAPSNVEPRKFFGADRLHLQMRLSVSGLYCSAITRSTDDDPASSNTMPPLRRRGELGKVLMDRVQN